MVNNGKKLIIAAQLSSVHSKKEQLRPGRVRSHVEKIGRQLPLDIIIAGWEEIPGLFEDLTSRQRRVADEIFLWYPFLSDYPDFDVSHLVVNLKDAKSRGWDGYQGTGINESFKQACPNNPAAVETSLKHMERLLTRYDFDGVFIDKIRFPSMANGLEDVFSCFCPHCIKKAAGLNLDLEAVKAALESKGKKEVRAFSYDIPAGAAWLETLIEKQSLLQQFIRFRTDSINQVVARIESLADRMGKKMSLDVFSPSLAPLVGQDFDFLGRKAAWVKPMIYRFGSGPSSLRSEVPAMVREFSSYLGVSTTDAMKWCAQHVRGLDGISLEQIEKAAPFSLLLEETRQAVKLFPATPVYLGLETVFIAGKMEVEPRHVEEIVEIGSSCGVQGYVLSWDLLHTPLENVLPLKRLKE